MTEMVERVARALFDDLRDRRGIKNAILHHEGLDHEAGFDDNKDWLMETARAAIAAMREPTVAMMAAGNAKIGRSNSISNDLMLRKLYRSIIDGALRT